MKKIRWAMIALYGILMQEVLGQTTPALQWWDPVETAVPVIGGRGWHSELAHPYDRLPKKAEETVRSAVWDLSQHSAGLYIDFHTNATTIVVRYTVKGSLAMRHMPATGVSGVDLYAKDNLDQWQWARGVYRFGDTIEYQFTGLKLPTEETRFRLYLPLYNSIDWITIGVPVDATFTPVPVSSERSIVLYGTSIMQGGCASRPGLAWPSILGRKLDVPMVNLGFSGNGQLEQPVIDLMSEQDARLFVLDCMPNLSGMRLISSEEVQRRIVSSVSALRAKHPSTPILLVEHCCGLPGANMDTVMTNKYDDASRLLAETFATMQQQGIENIYLLKAEDIGFDVESTVDGTHPNDIGMMKYADAYEVIIRRIFEEVAGDGHSSSL